LKNLLSYYSFIHHLKEHNKETTMAGSGEPNKFLPSEVLGSAKVGAESAQTSLGNQGEKVTTAAGEVKKNVVEYVDKAADHVHSKPEEPPKSEEGVIGTVKKTVGNLFK
jgi:hypothetical protein